MLLRILIYGYFPLLALGGGLARIQHNELWQGLGFIPPALYVTVRFARAALARQLRFRRGTLDPGIALAYAYVITYSVLYFPRSSAGLATLGTTPTLLVHVLFWHLVYTSRIYAGDRARYIQDVVVALSAGFLFGLANAVIFTGFTLAAGAVHDLAVLSPFVRSDLDVPALALVPIAVTISTLRRSTRKLFLHGVVPSARTGLLTLLSVFALWLYARRGPILCVPLIALLGLASNSLRRKALVTMLAIPFLPLLWQPVSSVLLRISQTEFVRAVLVRNSPEDYLTATGRLDHWLLGFEFLRDFRPTHLIGYGGAPRYLTLGDNAHMHNAVLDVFFDAGLLSLGLAILLVFVTFKRLLRLIDREGRLSEETCVLLLVLTSWLLLSAVEPILQSFFIPHLVFLLVVISIMNLSRNVKEPFFPSPSQATLSSTGG
ncbi:MAG: hypothetical protein WD942_10075 [Dehalococcoidia bacterium]